MNLFSARDLEYSIDLLATVLYFRREKTGGNSLTSQQPDKY